MKDVCKINKNNCNILNITIPLHLQIQLNRGYSQS